MPSRSQHAGRTHQAIVQVFLDAATERGVDGTSVSEVMRRAGLNRGTFYEYFSDINDLIVQVEDELLDDFRAHAHKVARLQGHLERQTAADGVARFLTQHDGRIYLLLSSKGDPCFVPRFRDALAENFQTIFGDSLGLRYPQYAVAAISCAVVGVLNRWYDGGRREPLAEVVSELQDVWLTGIERLRGNQQG